MRRPCIECGTPADGGRCETHQRKPWATRAVPRVDVPYRQRQAILERDGRVCYICGGPGADQVDHVVNQARGGTNDPSNLRAIHGLPCHEAKSRIERRPAQQ